MPTPDIVWPVHRLKTLSASWEGLYSEATRARQDASAEYVRLRHTDTLFVNLSDRPLIMDCDVEGGPSQRTAKLPGQWCFVPAGMTLRGALRPMHPFEYLVVAFDPGLVRQTLVPVVGDRRELFHPRLGVRDPAVLSTAKKFRTTLVDGGPVTPLYADALATVLLLELARAYALSPSGPPSAGGLGRRRERAVVEYLHAHAYEAISLETLANVAGLSRAHFHRAFRQSFGTSPHQYQLDLRIERAKSLLDEGRPVDEVSSAVGFRSPRHFSTRFRAAVGTSPRDYRGRT